jgi:serine/threonine protein kinase
MNTPNVIGEGAYGCIHKPSLLCKGKPISSYKNKVSKILPKEDAKVELAEYSKIREIDKSQEYYLGYPTECDVANIPTNIQAIDKCEKGKELLDKLDELSLLVMTDGGINLQEYVNKMENAPATPENITKMERFFIEFHRIICAINMYLKHGILHCDMKPQNVVFSESTGKMNIIDFGLTTAQKDLLTQSQKSKNQLARYHWSYPFEMFFLNKNVYMFFAKLSKEQRERYYQSILYSISGPRQRAATGGTSSSNVDKEKTTPPEYVEAIQGFYSYIFDHTTASEEFKQHMAGFYQTVVIEMTIANYNAFLKKSIQSIDVYGTGITLLYVVKKTKHLLSPKLYDDLYELGYSMVSTQLSERITASELLDRYESILTENDIMKKYSKYFKNHKVVNREPIPKYMKTSLNNIHMGDILLNQQDLDKIAVSLSLDDKPKKSPKVSRKRTKKQPIQKGGRKNRCTYKRRN